MLRLIVEHISMSTKKKDNSDRIRVLKNAEKYLFDTYNWRANAKVKLAHLSRLIDVIIRLDELENGGN